MGPPSGNPGEPSNRGYKESRNRGPGMTGHPIPGSFMRIYKSAAAKRKVVSTFYASSSFQMDRSYRNSRQTPIPISQLSVVFCSKWALNFQDEKSPTAPCPMGDAIGHCG